MFKRTPDNGLLALVVAAVLMLPFTGQAAGLEVTIITQVASDTGINGGDFVLSLNGSPLNIVDEQAVLLAPGDVLRGEASASAMTEINQPSSIRRDIRFEFQLADGTDSAIVQTTYSADATTAGGVLATGGSDNENLCAFSSGCTVDGLPGFFAGLNGVISENLESTGGNKIFINNVEMPTGRVGGPENLDLDFAFNLARRDGLTEAPSGRAWIGALALTTGMESSASGSFSFELTVVPVPAAAGLFGSALGLLGYLRRRGAGSC